MTSKFPNDRIAELYPHVNEEETKLPRTWNNLDKSNNIGLCQNNLRAQYKGPGKSIKDAASVRATSSIPATCGLYYFEVKVVSKGREGYIGVGLCTNTMNPNKQPGWEKDSYGYHADDGNAFCSSAPGEVYGPPFSTDDVVGCGLNLVDRTCFYTKNGVNLGIAFRDMIPNLYPTVGLQTPGEIVDVNFGQQAFVFDIDEMRRELQASTMRCIENFPVSKINGSWHAMLQRIVSAYLVHYGYCTTAEVFAKSTGQSIAEELSSIRNRQRIQKLVMAGRISEAIDTTQTLYPGLLDQNADLFFQLKCRQFIEMVNGCDGEVKAYVHSPSRIVRASPNTSPARVRNSPCSSPGPSRQNSQNYTQQRHSSHSEQNNSYNEYQNVSEQSNGVSNSVIKNGSGEANNMLVDEYMENGVCENNETEHEARTDISDESMETSDDMRVSAASGNLSSAVSVIRNSKDPVPSIRQLCGGNIFAIEKLLAFGKTLQSLYKEISNASKCPEENKTLMKEAFSLLAYNNPRDSPVGYLLESDQREGICSTLNSAILEAHKLPGQPALELSIAQIQNCLKAMGKNGLGACAVVDFKDYLYHDNAEKSP